MVTFIGAFSLRPLDNAKCYHKNNNSYVEHDIYFIVFLLFYRSRSEKWLNV